MRETGIHAESERFVQSYKCSSGIFTQQGSTVVYKEKQINLHNMESVHTRILTATCTWGWVQAALAVGAICGFELDCWRGFNTLKVS